MRDLNTEIQRCTIECDCGTHILKVESQINTDPIKMVNGKPLVLNQEYYLAMFYYGIRDHRRSWWSRIPIALKYLWTGRMFADQLCLTPEEAYKLFDFINETLIPTDYQYEKRNPEIA